MKTFEDKTALLALAILLQWATAAISEEPVTVEKLTSGPAFHWFGYYDKFQFDPTDRYVLGMKVTFEHRLPTEKDAVKIGMIDLEDGNRWIELGESRAWSWQQLREVNPRSMLKDHLAHETFVGRHRGSSRVGPHTFGSCWS